MCLKSLALEVFELRHLQYVAGVAPPFVFAGTVAGATARTVRGGEVAAMSEAAPAGTAEVAEVESVGTGEVVEVFGLRSPGAVAGGAVCSAECSGVRAQFSGAGLL